MNRKKHRYSPVEFVVYFFIAAIFVLSFLSVLRYYMYEHPGNIFQRRAPWLQNLLIDEPENALNPDKKYIEAMPNLAATAIDWAQRYPFTMDCSNTEQPVLQETLCKPFLNDLSGLLDTYTQWVHSKKDTVTYIFKDMIPAYRQTITLSAGINDLIGWNIPQYGGYNPIMELEENYFTSAVLPQEMTEGAAAVIDFHNFCKDLDIPLLFVLPPCKVDAESDTDVVNCIDFSNYNRDVYTGFLNKSGISYLDLRQDVKREHMTTHELFFETDHHWKPETGLWATNLIAQKMNNMLDCKIDTELFDPDQFDSVILEDFFLGSQGRKATLARACPESINFIYPLYDTQFRLQIPTLNLDVIDDFHTIFQKEFLDEPDVMLRNSYAAYMYGDRPLIRFENCKESTSANVLVIKDSFANVVTPYLAQAFSKLDIVDLRSFTGSIRTFIKETKPDIVVLIYSSTPPEYVDLSTHKDIYDFR